MAEHVSGKTRDGRASLTFGLRASFGSCVFSLSRWSLLFVVVNFLYFWLIFAGVFVAQIPSPALYELPLALDPFAGFMENPALLVIVIFLFNLVVSGFFVTTLPGLLFFALPFVVVSWRALVWGILLAQLPTRFLLAMPTLILEGEGYVLGALAGVVLGLAWLKPRLVYPDETLSRSETVRLAFKECGRIYVLAVLVLFAAAVVETVTLVVL